MVRRFVSFRLHIYTIISKYTKFFFSCICPFHLTLLTLIRRCKWSPDGDKASLVAAQKALETVLADVKMVDGVKSVERVVCGGCLDFKVRFF